MPATDTDFDREFADIVGRLREVPADVPESLRARVRALGEPQAPPTLRDRLAAVSWRRGVLVAAPVCLAVLASAAVVHGVVSSGGPRQEAVSTVAGSSSSGGKTSAPAQPEWGVATTDQ